MYKQRCAEDNLPLNARIRVQVDRLLRLKKRSVQMSTRAFFRAMIWQDAPKTGVQARGQRGLTITPNPPSLSPRIIRKHPA